MRSELLSRSVSGEACALRTRRLRTDTDRSYSGTLRTRYCMAASSVGNDPRRLDAKDDGCDKKVTASRDCAPVKPRNPSCRVTFPTSSSENEKEGTVASGCREIAYSIS